MNTWSLALRNLLRAGRLMTLRHDGEIRIRCVDLVGRKLPQGAGRMLRTFFHPVSAFIEQQSSHKQLGEMIKGFAKAFGALQLATAHIAATGTADPEEAETDRHGITSALRKPSGRSLVASSASPSRSSG